ncbi:F0F1 ATP synthase subunit delta [Candidatus Woesebacteria bacterium]|nr:F0F1 ATP synthase subunit delta [Candidatus Woesebacteria bacterium]
MTDQAQLIAKTLLAHLKEKGDTRLIGQIVDILVASPEYKNSKSRVVLSSATKLEASELKGIKSYLEKGVGKDYEFVELIDPSLVAGFTLQINDTFIDASVLGKINTVSNKLTAKD